MEKYMDIVSLLTDVLTFRFDKKNANIAIKSVKVKNVKDDQDSINFKFKFNQGKVKVCYYFALNDYAYNGGKIIPKEAKFKNNKVNFKLNRKYIYEYIHLVIFLVGYDNNITARYVVIKPEVKEGFENDRNEIVNGVNINDTHGTYRSSLKFKEISLVEVTSEILKEIEDEFGPIRYKGVQKMNGVEVNPKFNTTTVEYGQNSIVPQIWDLAKKDILIFINEYIPSK